jgi:hypothetical protein
MLTVDPTRSTGFISETSAGRTCRTDMQAAAPRLTTLMPSTYAACKESAFLSRFHCPSSRASFPHNSCSYSTETSTCEPKRSVPCRISDEVRDKRVSQPKNLLSLLRVSEHPVLQHNGRRRNLDILPEFSDTHLEYTGR